MSASKFVAKVREMLAAATPGPWRNNPGGCCERIDSGYGFRVIDSDGFRYSDGNVRGNIDLIAATPTLLAASCDRIEKLEKAILIFANKFQILQAKYLIQRDVHFQGKIVHDDLGVLIKEVFESISALDAEDAEVHTATTDENATSGGRE